MELYLMVEPNETKSFIYVLNRISCASGLLKPHQTQTQRLVGDWQSVHAIQDFEQLRDEKYDGK